MSYDIYIKDPVSLETLTLTEPHHMRGGTYALGGTREAHINITYNYGVHFERVFPTNPPNAEVPEFSMLSQMFGNTHERGIRTLYGKSALECIPLLEDAIAKLGDDATERYWDATEGNAKRALIQLLTLCRMCPHGIVNGD